jgi:hypothetical protein
LARPPPLAPCTFPVTVAGESSTLEPRHNPHDPTPVDPGSMVPQGVLECRQNRTPSGLLAVPGEPLVGNTTQFDFRRQGCMTQPILVARMGDFCPIFLATLESQRRPLHVWPSPSEVRGSRRRHVACGAANARNKASKNIQNRLLTRRRPHDHSPLRTCMLDVCAMRHVHVR